MIEQIAGTKILSRLRNEFRTLVVAVPCRRRVDRKFQALRLRRIRRVLIAAVDRKVVRSRLTAVDVLNVQKRMLEMS